MASSAIRKIRRRVWFHRCSSILWAIFGLVSFALGWQSAIALVWTASVYANVKSDWAAGEAADDRLLIERLDKLLEQQSQILKLLQGRSE